MSFILRKILAAVLFTLIMCPSIRAGGLWLYEEGTPDLGGQRRPKMPPRPVAIRPA